MNSKQYTVAIIGAGRIAAGFDSPDSPHVLTHAHAYAKNSQTTLIGFVDVDGERGKNAARVWGTQSFGSLEELCASQKPDIIVIASPDETHGTYLRECARFTPKLIVCEKPVRVSKEERASLRSELGNIPVIVNFSRRFDESVQSVRLEVESGAYGAILSASAIYTGGLFHNGSHALDLAQLFFGDLRSVRATGNSIEDRPLDSTVGGLAVYEKCPEFHLISADARAYSIFEFSILTENARIQFLDHGRTLAISHVVPDPEYAGYSGLSTPQVTDTHFSEVISELVRHAVQVIEGNESSRSTLDNAFAVDDACTQFAERARAA